MNPGKLNDYWREHYEERAAIMEHDAGMNRHDAEQASWGEVIIMILKGEK